MSNQFEAAVYQRGLLVYTLNRYAGPSNTAMGKIPDEAERQKQMTPIDLYSGDVPLAGHALPGAPALVHPPTAATTVKTDDTDKPGTDPACPSTQGAST